MNRHLVKIHDLHVRLLHKVKNVYAADGCDLFFISDVPHFIKMVRNCWSSKSRNLWVSLNLNLPLCILHLYNMASILSIGVVSSLGTISKLCMNGTVDKGVDWYLSIS